MAKFIPYPETVQFRQVVDYVTRHMNFNDKDDNTQLPILKFSGTAKLHGANAAIVYQRNIGHWYQSRNRIISAEKDNAGFFQDMDKLAENFLTQHVFPNCPTIREYYNESSTIVIYGEWCGGDIQGQSNVAITSLPKMFVIFKIQILSQKRGMSNHKDNSKQYSNKFWLDPKEWTNIKWHEASIYNIYEFPTFDIEIDFNNPELAQESLTQMTEEVERQCPVGAYFQRIGYGEGIVWTEWNRTHGSLLFKVKGRQYAIVNSTTLVPVRTVKLNSAKDFIDYACTDNRMKQAYDSIRQESGSIEIKDFSTFVRWLTEDIIKEEKDTMDAVYVNPRDLVRLITNKAQTWFDNRLIQDRKINTRRKKILH